MIIFGIHPVRTACQFLPERVRSIWAKDKTLAERLQLTTATHIQIGIPSAHQKLDHQGVVADFQDAGWIIPGAEWSFEALPQGTYVAADHIEDPQNFGAIARSAALLGVNALIFAKDRQVGLTPAVVKASAGLIFSLTLIRVSNVGAFVRSFKKHTSGWVYGLDAQAEISLSTIEAVRPWCMVVGGEHAGLTKPVKGACDGLFYIPTRYPEHSLNAAQAVSIALYHLHASNRR